MTVTLEDLKKLAAAGKRQRFVFFWGHKPRRVGTVGAECFSQWYGAAFEVEGDRYRTAEHYMMAEKARLFRDEENRKRILDAGSPGSAKAIGREVRGFREDVWVTERSKIVVQANLAKFTQHPSLKDCLLATKSSVLVEASPKDRIWGIGLGVNDLRAKNPLQWRGLNLLGFALMDVREQLT